MPYVQRDGGVIVGLFAVLQPEMAEEYLADDAAAVVAFRAPKVFSVTPLQARRALRAAGLLPTVNAWVASQPDEDIKDAWEFASVIERHGAIVLAAAPALELSEAQLDALFVAAAQL